MIGTVIVLNIARMKLPKLVCLFLLIFIAELVLASAEITCPQRVIFLPQFHTLDKSFAAKLEPEELEAIARSQFQIAKFLEAHKSLPVFSEQATRDSVWEDLSIPIRARVLAAMDMIMPSGLPERFEDLDAEQMEKLIEDGAEIFQFKRGKIPVIYRTIENEEIHQKLFAPVREWFQKNPGSMQSYSPKIRDIIYTQRERMTLEQIKKFFFENPQQTEVILIYGAGHNFNFHPDVFDGNCIQIPEEFQKSWLGKRRSK